MKTNRILVIDDEETMLRTIKHGMEQTGRYCVAAFNNPIEAEYAAAVFRPDLVILDVMMPRMSGPELAERIRSYRKFEDVPVIFVTAFIAPNGKIPDRLANEQILHKPVSLKDLIDAVDQRLGL